MLWTLAELEGGRLWQTWRVGREPSSLSPEGEEPSHGTMPHNPPDDMGSFRRRLSRDEIAVTRSAWSRPRPEIFLSRWYKGTARGTNCETRWAMGGSGMRMDYETGSTPVDWLSAGLWIVLALGLVSLFIVINSKVVPRAQPAVSAQAEAQSRAD
jgi:hypothetical protein